MQCPLIYENAGLARARGGGRGGGGSRHGGRGGL